MPPKEEMKNGSAKPKAAKEPFDVSEHKVKQIDDKHIITLNI